MNEKFESLNETDQALVREQLIRMNGTDPSTGVQCSFRDPYYGPRLEEVYKGNISFNTLANEYLQNVPQFLGNARANEEVRKKNAADQGVEYRDPVDRLTGPRICIELPSVPSTGGERVR